MMCWPRANHVIFLSIPKKQHSRRTSRLEMLGLNRTNLNLTKLLSLLKIPLGLISYKHEVSNHRDIKRANDPQTQTLHFLKSTGTDSRKTALTGSCAGRLAPLSDRPASDRPGSRGPGRLRCPQPRAGRAAPVCPRVLRTGLSWPDLGRATVARRRRCHVPHPAVGLSGPPSLPPATCPSAAGLSSPLRGVLLPRPNLPLLRRKAPAGRRAAPRPSPPRPPAAPPLLTRARPSPGEGRWAVGAHARHTQHRKLRRSSEPRPRRPATCRPLPGLTSRPGCPERHVGFFERRRHEESGPAAPAGGRAQPREGERAWAGGGPRGWGEARGDTRLPGPGRGRGGGPPFRRPPTLGGPGEPLATSVSHVSPQTHSQPSSFEHTRVRLGSSRRRPDEQLCGSSRESVDSTFVGSSLEQRGVWSRRRGVLVADLAGCLFTGSSVRETHWRWPGSLRSGWGVGSWAADFWGKAFCPCW